MPNDQEVTGSEGVPQEVLDEIREMSRRLLEGTDVSGAAARIVSTSLQVIDGAEEGGISLLLDGEIMSIGASAEAIAELDGFQHRIGEGPCVRSIQRSNNYLVRDTSNDETWPRFSREAEAKGFRSILAFVLELPGETLGALNLYGREPGAFTAADVRDGAVFAAYATYWLAHAEVHGSEQEKVLQLEQALLSRDVIGQAKGILMEREGCTGEEAFNMLRIASQHLNRKLREVADEIVEAAEARATGSGDSSKGGGPAGVRP